MQFKNYIESVRRKNVRTLIDLEVSFESRDKKYSGHIVDINYEGMFISTKNLLSVGDEVKISFVTDEEIAEPDFFGKVIRIKEKKDDPASQTQGMAIAFTDLGE